MPQTVTTHDYDPRFDRAQTVAGAKARYLSDDLPGYGVEDLETDLDRLLSDGGVDDEPDLSAFGSNETLM